MSAVVVNNNTKTTTTSGTSVTVSFTPTSGSTLVLVMTAMNNYGVGQNQGTIASVTYAGAAMTRLVRIASTGGGTGNGNDEDAEIWYLENPPAGASSVVVKSDTNNSYEIAVTVLALANARLNKTLTASKGLGSAAKTISTSITPSVSSRGLVVAASSIRSTSGTATIASGHTLIAQQLAGTDCTQCSSYVATTSTAAVTPSFTWTTADEAAMAVAFIGAADETAARRTDLMTAL